MCWARFRTEEAECFLDLLGFHVLCERCKEYVEIIEDLGGLDFLGGVEADV